MGELLDIRVDGVPAAQGSKTYLGNGRMVESSKQVKPWRGAIMLAVAEAVPVDQATDRPVAVDLDFMMPRPRSHLGTGRNADRVRDSAPRHPTGKPDLDKLIRAVLDGIGGAGRVWRDDSQVVVVRAAKQYAAPGGTPGVYITVRYADDQM